MSSKFLILALRIPVAFAATTWLAACGGGGDSTSSVASVVAANASVALAATNANIVANPASDAIAAAPLVISQPRSVAVNSGQAVTFDVGVSGGAGLTYQWTRNGVPISGANQTSFTIAATQISDSGARFAVVVSNAAGTTSSVPAGLTVNAVSSNGASATRPFSDRSLWNARPSQFTLGTDIVPKSVYFPFIGPGAYSVAAAIASDNDLPATVIGMSGKAGVWVPDTEAYANQVVIPHWPATVTPASGSDGHADIIDAANNRIHSFWQLRKDASGQWRAAQYTWTALNGSGWGTPAEYMQGSRATGVVPIAGIIRNGEINDGQPIYRHALAMSLTNNALAAKPASTFPATMADGDAAYVNTGAIPEGTRLMLPASFDTSSITDPALLKVVLTLKSFGAYVVDRNSGTPYVIYVENGSDFNLMPSGWNSRIAAQLDAIRGALRPIAHVDQWVDALGVPFTPDQDLNLLSMRGGWTLTRGKTVGSFDSWAQAVTFSDDGVYTVQTNASGRSMPTSPNPGDRLHLVVKATGDATLRIVLNGTKQYYDSGVLHDGEQAWITWPPSWAIPTITVSSGPSGGGTISATLVRTNI